MVEEYASRAERKPRCRANRRVNRFVADGQRYDAYGYLACGQELSHEGDHCDPDAGVSWYVGNPRGETLGSELPPGGIFVRLSLELLDVLTQDWSPPVRVKAHKVGPEWELTSMAVEQEALGSELPPGGIFVRPSSMSVWQEYEALKRERDELADRVQELGARLGGAS